MRVLGRHCAWPDHRAGDQAGQRGRTQGLPLLVRHAGRGRAHRRRRRGIPPRLPKRDRRDRHGRPRRRADDPAGHFDQALGAASALRAGAAPAPARRTYPRALALLEGARAGNIAVTIDAEESERLEPSLDLFERLPPRRAGRLERPRPRGPGLSEAGNPHRLLEALAARGGGIPVRLVKGAYWDSEIKRTQEQGLDEYPIHAQARDRRVLPRLRAASARRRRCILPAVRDPQCRGRSAASSSSPATGATSSSSACTAWARRCTRGWSVPTRAVSSVGCTPVGSHQDLLPYLVRRLLENGANTCSSTASSMRRCRSRRWSRTCFAAGAHRAQAPSKDPVARRAIWPRAAQFARR